MNEKASTGERVTYLLGTHLIVAGFALVVSGNAFWGWFGVGVEVAGWLSIFFAAAHQNGRLKGQKEVQQ